MEHVILFGDSLTEQGYSSGWVSALSNYYIRRANVINCGLSGYNTRWFLNVLREDATRARLIPDNVNRPLFATLLLGSNDLASHEQHVPLAEFKDNLKALVHFIQTEMRPKAGIYVMTPPPIDQEAWMAYKKHSELQCRFADTLLYRGAVVEAVAELQLEGVTESGQEVFLVDTHTAFLQYAQPQEPAGGSQYDRSSPWTQLFYDGLHFGREGGALMYQTLMNALQRSPHAKLLDANSIPMALPAWGDLVPKV